mmetsp:Transcript_147684/g.375196  ORF Transcript_147684/g.375196 Transcript_147684/m.375196 type:complete len:245 (+) Transcript_147684:102-836(+)
MPRPQRPSVRVGDAAITCDVSEVAMVTTQLRRSQVLPRGCHKHKADLFASISLASSDILESLVSKFSLRGRADKFLSTALRVRAVRDSLIDHPELCDTLGYISDAADALRHLTPFVVDRAARDLRAVFCSDPSHSTPPSPSAPSSASTSSTSCLSTCASTPPTMLRHLLGEQEASFFRWMSMTCRRTTSWPLLCLPILVCEMLCHLARTTCRPCQIPSRTWNRSCTSLRTFGKHTLSPSWRQKT